MTKQRNRPSLGQAALMTGLLGVGGWLASSALSPSDANASELPPDPGSYSGSIQPDAGSVDLNQLSNSVLNQIAQLRANGHDVSVGVPQEDSGQIPAALRGSSNSDSSSRNAWKQAAQQVAATPSAPVLPRSTAPAETPAAASSDAGSATAPVAPQSRRRSHSGDVPAEPASAADHRGADQNTPPPSTPPSAPDVGFGPENEIPSGTGQDTNTEIGDDATARDRLGANYKESLAPYEIKNTGVDGTLIEKAPDIGNVVNLTQQVVEAVKAGTIQPVNGPEAIPSDGLDPDLTSLPYAAAVTAHYVNKWGYTPIKARVVAAQKLRKAVADVNSVTGRPPSATDPVSSADLTKPDAVEGEVPVSELPPPPLMRPFGWQANQGTPDPGVEGQKWGSSEDELMRGFAERSINGETGYVRPVGSIGGNRGESPVEEVTAPRTPLTNEEVDKWWNEREAQRAADDARVRPKIGDFENKADAAPTEAPSETAAAPTEAQEQADADASAAAAASEQEALTEEAATIKENGAESQAAEAKNVAASQAAVTADQQQERAEQAKETATETTEQGLSQEAGTEYANGEAAEAEAASSAKFVQNEQNAEAAQLSRPAEGSGGDADVAGEGEGEAVPEGDSDDSDVSDGDADTSGDSAGSDEGAGVDEGVGPPEGEIVTPQQNYMNGLPSGEADNTGEAEESGEIGKPVGPNGG